MEYLNVLFLLLSLNPVQDPPSKMGCTSSKQALRDKLLDDSQPLPLSRRETLPHPFTHKINESYHSITVTSTTIGSLKLDRHHLEIEHTANKAADDKEKLGGLGGSENEQQDFAVKVYRAKAWSTTTEKTNFPTTPTLTPSHEPEIINAWELMEGLEDSSSFCISTALGIDRSFSFHAYSVDLPDMAVVASQPTKTPPNSLPDSGAASPSRVGWLQMSPVGSVFSEFDPEIIAGFRKALSEVSSASDALSLWPSKPPKAPPQPSKPNPKKAPSLQQDIITGMVKATVSQFQDKIDRKRPTENFSIIKVPPGGEEKVVLYLTSLRGVRKTYEDCCGVRMVLMGYGIWVDERDVSMHQVFKEELKELVGGVTLPRVFVKGMDVGGADEVKQLHEAGQMEQLLYGCNKVHADQYGTACDACGGVRFVSCHTCYGSCKVYLEDKGLDGGVFQRCSHCNENGIIRCPLCCA